MHRRIASGAHLWSQLWARRREFGSPLFWRKALRVGGRLAQAKAWPEALLRRQLGVFARRPWNLHVEVTNACNADCIFCAYQFQERKRGVMTMPVFEKALADYVAMGGGDLLLEVVVGDPVLDPTFLEKIHLARAWPEIASIETITNGIGLDRVGAERLVASGISRVFISTAGFDRESYERIYRTKKYDQMRDNVLQLLRANDRAGRPVEVTIGFRTNRPLRAVLDDPDFRELRAFAPAIDFTYAFDDWGGRIDFATLPPGFLRRRPPRQDEPCKWLYDGPIVFQNGDVGLCGCRDVEASSELIVGNVLERSLREIWTSARVADLRARFLTPEKPDICRSCTRYRDLDDLRSAEGLAKTRLTRARLGRSACEPRPGRPAAPSPLELEAR